MTLIWTLEGQNDAVLDLGRPNNAVWPQNMIFQLPSPPALLFSALFRPPKNHNPPNQCATCIEDEKKQKNNKNGKHIAIEVVENKQ